MRGAAGVTRGTETPGDRLDEAATLLRALGSPIRLLIIDELRDGERCVHELIEATERRGRAASQSLVSQHLRVLRGARLVTAQRRGQEMAYRLVDTHVAHIATDAMGHVAEQP